MVFGNAEDVSLQPDFHNEIMRCDLCMSHKILSMGYDVLLRRYGR